MEYLVKTCNNCLEDKLMSEFHRETKSKSGRQQNCKNCHNKMINKYLTDKRKIDPAFHKSAQLSILMSNCLKKKFQKSYLEKYLDCSIDVFYKWIQHQFTNEMSWLNYGKYWEIDHILAKSHFNHLNEEEVLLCWNFRNLRPVTKEVNQKKRDKIDYQLYYQSVSLASEFLDRYDDVEDLSEIFANLFLE